MCPKCGEMIPVPRSLTHPEERHLEAYGHARSLTWREQLGEWFHALREPKILGLAVFGMGFLAILLM